MRSRKLLIASEQRCPSLREVVDQQHGDLAETRFKSCFLHSVAEIHATVCVRERRVIGSKEANLPDVARFGLECPVAIPTPAIRPVRYCFRFCPKAAVMTGEASLLCRQHPQTGHPLRLYGI